MKIGIDLRQIAWGATGGPTPWLLEALRGLLARGGPHEYVLFNTISNYHLFPDPPANVARYTLSSANYAAELQDRVEYEGDYDLLLRAGCEGALTRFPLDRQVACLADWAPAPARFASDGERELRRALRTYQTGAGALAVPDEAALRALLADAWTTTEDVFVLPADPRCGADALLAAFDRVAGLAERPAAPVHVSTPPLVSVVTPSFNQGGFIRETIDSVLGQDYPRVDYFVVDGGSTDETVPILKSYGDRIRWVSEPDRGQTHAINKGMAQARGEILAYLNSDDLLRPGAVSRVVRHFLARPACDLVYGRDAMLDREGRYLKMYPTADYSFERLHTECCVSQPAAFWRRRLADAVGPFDESLQLTMDYDYWMRADRAGGVLEHVPDVLAHTRIHRDAKSSGAGKIEAYQSRYFQELFDLSLRHAGHVSNHYVQLWLYVCVFNRYRLTRDEEELILHLCVKWNHYRYRCGWGRRRAAGALLREEGWRLPRLLARAAYRVLVRPRPRLKVESDLWLGPELTVPHAGGPVRLAGVPARNSILRIYSGGDELAEVPLEADKPADVCVEAPSPGPLRLCFSDSELLPDGRRASFRLRGTTLFTERDAA